MGTVYFHIGTMKTASTAIQDFLPLNEDVLERKGYCFPLMDLGLPKKYARRNAHFLHYFSLLDTEEARLEEENRLWREGFDIVAACAEKFENIILSDEIMWYRQVMRERYWERIRKELDQLGLDFRVIVYLRRQDTFLESYWNQSVKGAPRNSISFREYYQTGKWEFIQADYAANLQRMEKWVGRERITVRVFERSQLKGDIYSDFLDAVGLAFSDEYRIPESDANDRISNDYAEIKRYINAYPGYREASNFYLTPLWKSTAVMEEMTKSKDTRGMFTPEERKAFLEQFAESNAWVAREYLGRSDGIMFSGGGMDREQWQPPSDPAQVMRLLTLLMTGADMALLKRIEKLERTMRYVNRPLKTKILTKLHLKK